MIYKYEQANIPLEHVWLDIPYMKKFADFSVDTDAFPFLTQFADDLHDKKMRMVVILDPGLSADDPENKYYKMAQEKDILIKSSVNPNKMNGALVAKVFTDQTVFIDWFNSKTYELWSAGLDDLFSQTHFDGLWLDMNELTIFCSGECPKSQMTEENIEGVVKRMLYEGKDTTILKDDSSWYFSYKD